MLALKTMQEQLAKAGEKVEEWENAYWAENRMSSRNAEEMKAYRRDHFAPLVKAQVEKKIISSKNIPEMIPKHQVL